MMTKTLPWVRSVVLGLASPVPTWPPFSCILKALFLSIAGSVLLGDTALLGFSGTLCPTPEWERVDIQACCQVS